MVAAVLVALLMMLSGCSASSTKEQAAAFKTAQKYYESGKFAAAQQELEALLEADADNVEALNTLALALAAQGKNDEAITVYQHIVKLDPDDHASWYRMALLERLMGDTAKSESHLVRALAAKPGDAGYSDELARTKMALGKFQEAATLWGGLAKKSGASKESKKEFYLLQGQAYQSAQDYKRAKTAFKKALKLDPNDSALVERVATFN